MGPTINQNRYICPNTGAHFEFRDMYRRLEVVRQKREFDPRDPANASKALNKEVLADQNAIQDAIKKKKHQDALNQMEFQYLMAQRKHATEGAEQSPPQNNLNLH